MIRSGARTCGLAADTVSWSTARSPANGETTGQSRRNPRREHRRRNGDEKRPRLDRAVEEPCPHLSFVILTARRASVKRGLRPGLGEVTGAELGKWQQRNAKAGPAAGPIVAILEQRGCRRALRQSAG